MEMKLLQQANVDYLTLASNRGYFMEQAELELNRAIRYGSPLSLLMLDIDFFKQVNDTHGHKAGDIVLKKLVEVCRETLREVDVIGRIGGEEFAILLPETPCGEAVEVAERLRQVMENTKVPLDGGLPIRFSLSIGVTSLNSREDNIDVLLNLADKALYKAKKSGRNKVCVTVQ
jgi:diguanylate cyclase (GGDEF)-like protein